MIILEYMGLLDKVEVFIAILSYALSFLVYITNTNPSYTT